MQHVSMILHDRLILPGNSDITGSKVLSLKIVGKVLKKIDGGPFLFAVVLLFDYIFDTLSAGLVLFWSCSGPGLDAFSS